MNVLAIAGAEIRGLEMTLTLMKTSGTSTTTLAVIFRKS